MPIGARPRLGFLGVGWIGRNRMEAIAAAGVADVVCVADAVPDAAADAAEAVGAQVAPAEDLLAGVGDLDGVVIATPSALHAAQSITAPGNGLAAVCQEP